MIKLKNCKIMSKIHIFGSKYFYLLWSDNCSSCSCNWLSLKFAQRVTILQTVSKSGSDSKRTDKHDAVCSKAVCWGVKSSM